jgi:hypothetical protein
MAFVIFALANANEHNSLGITVVESATPRKEFCFLEDDMTDQEFQAAAELLGFEIPEPCKDGVEANLHLLAAHARVLDGWVEERDQP